MSILDKVQFWKKNEEAPTDTPVWSTPEAVPGQVPGAPGIAQPHGMPDFGSPPPMNEPVTTEITGQPMPHVAPPPALEPVRAPSPSSTGGKDLELITAKLDTIKAQLETLNNRIAHLEKIAEGSQPPKGW